MADEGIRFEEVGDRLRLVAGDAVLAEYVFRPDTPTLESPRPYLDPIRTRRGELVSLYRPHDHVWHKGITWSLPVVGDENFWGGPTFVRGEGYVQLPNNGEQRHVGFADPAPTADTDATADLAPAEGAGAGASIRPAQDDAVARVAEDLDWVTEAGEHVFAERRELAAALVDDDTWVLVFATRMRNLTDRAIPIGSPTTRGRDNAGYGGLFWRGPRSFTGGTILAPGRAGGDELRGERAPWFGFTGRHDGTGASSTLVMVDDVRNVQHPPQWFARTDEFACLCPAPFFSEEHPVEPGGELVERVAVVIADGGADPGRAEALAAHGRALLDALRPSDAERGREPVGAVGDLSRAETEPA